MAAAAFATATGAADVGAAAAEVVAAGIAVAGSIRRLMPRPKIAVRVVEVTIVTSRIIIRFSSIHSTGP